ncbi:unnamed protein product [Oncorhynchus mykiss]|uniref:DNA-3-methyladenine glycosylase II n=1 Tax=Oncorhynchus mykiss TaxID=8022 RepID=A0A060XSW5_ONCMY|nr:unnamed protein product [Oncorhynchus mykiss]
MGSRELEGKTTKGGIGFGDIPAGARATSGCCYAESQVKRGVSLRQVRSTVHDHESSDVDDVRPGTVKSQYFSKEGDQQRLGEEFFNQPCISLAKAFLGKVLVCQSADGTELRGRVVETEA